MRTAPLTVSHERRFFARPFLAYALRRARRAVLTGFLMLQLLLVLLAGVETFTEEGRRHRDFQCDIATPWLTEEQAWDLWEPCLRVSHCFPQFPQGPLC
jgi:hypothetical protein